MPEPRRGDLLRHNPLSRGLSICKAIHQNGLSGTIPTESQEEILLRRNNCVGEFEIIDRTEPVVVCVRENITNFNTGEPCGATLLYANNFQTRCGRELRDGGHVKAKGGGLGRACTLSDTTVLYGA